VILIAASDAAPMSWKNGGGVTRELLRLPANGDDWTLRISVADIATDGPFSPFPGISRWFAVLSGAGVRLRWRACAKHVHARQAPLHFDGGDAPDCTLFDGPTRNLNVMVRSSHARVAVSAASLRDETWALRTIGMGLFALQPVRLHGPRSSPVEMPALSLCWQEPPFGPARPWSIESSLPFDGQQAQTPASPGYWISLSEPSRSLR
jgi:environmental stress-induced protein Ves